MNLVLFYEKPGCTTNARQKKILTDAGCMLIVQNLLELSMGPDELRSYLEARPVPQWFNPNAPAVKNGEIDPHAFNAETALPLLLENPILIRRPLISVNGQRMCGIDPAKIEALINVSLGGGIDNSCSASDDGACREP
ncbi:MAG: ArsC/Spx/MgsR family protein [Campylobacterales bacterium]